MDSSYVVKSFTYQGTDDARDLLFSNAVDNFNAFFNGATASVITESGEESLIQLTLPKPNNGTETIFLNLVKTDGLIVEGEQQFLYEMPSQTVTYVFSETLINNTTVDNKITFTISHPINIESSYTSKTIRFNAVKESATSLSDLLEIALAGAGLESTVTSVNGQIGDVELDIPVTHVGRYEPEGIVDT